jgi:hypothetical protein
MVESAAASQGPRRIIACSIMPPPEGHFSLRSAGFASTAREG